MPAPIISVAQMRQWEQESWDAGRSVNEVIGKVGKIVAERALKMTRANDRILLLAGKGHNGDDVRCSQPHLTGRRVKLLNVSVPGSAMTELERSLGKEPALVIDGLFGIGLNRQLDDKWAEFIETINKSGLPVLAVDVPSGLNADTGETEGIGLYAQVTLTVGAPKRGLVRGSAYSFVGRLEVAPEIGLIPCPHESEFHWTLPEDFKHFPPPRRVESHKGTYGHVAIVAGSAGYAGAAVLAARGAVRARPGLISVFCAEEVYEPVASQLQQPMVHRWDAGLRLPESCTALLIGPGLAAPDLTPKFKEWTNDFWKNYPLPVIVDASALDWLEPGSTPLNSRRIITPHPGEAARMLQTKPSVVQENRVAAVRELSARYGNCWVVLKGHQTLVGRSSGDLYYNSSGSPFLAQGGAGDVLAGFLGGLLAQTRLQPHPFKTIRYGVWEHGATADAINEKGEVWTIEDLLTNLGNVAPQLG